MLSVPSASTFNDLFAVFSLVFNAVCVAIEIGLFESEVLSTLFKPKLTLASVAVIAPVPPF